MPALVPQVSIRLFAVYIRPVENLLFIVPEWTFAAQVSVVRDNLDGGLFPRTLLPKIGFHIEYPRSYARREDQAKMQNPRIRPAKPANIVMRDERLAPFHSPTASPHTLDVRMIADMKSGHPKTGPMSVIRVAAAP